MPTVSFYCVFFLLSSLMTRANCSSDINECEARTDACHKDAYCSNYDGYFTCTCVSGYSGNGTVCIAPEKCQAPLDLIFLLDASGSVGKDNYVKEKEFIKIVASRYDLATTSKAAVIAFSSQASNEVQLGSMGTALSFATAVDNIPYDARSTRIDLALRLAYDEYFASEDSNDTQKLVILLTDGKQTLSSSMTQRYIPIEDTVQLLRSKAARIFAVTIGSNIDMSAMRAVTEEDDDIFQVTEFNDLVANADSISKTSCVDALQRQGIAVCSTDPEMTNCPFPAHCVNTSSNVSCVCRNGYSNDPPQCADNGPDTEIGLKIIFSDLVYDSERADQWKTRFCTKVIEIYTGDAYFMEIKNISVSESDGNAAVSFTLKFTRITWRSMLSLQLAMENGTFLGSSGFLDERSCENKDNDNFICEVPQNATASTIKHNSVTVTMDPVSVPQHNDYFYGYRILYKNLDDPSSQWATRSQVIRNNVAPIMAVVYSLRPYTNYSFRVSALSFQSEGLISEAHRVRTAQWVPSVGPVIVSYRNTSSTSIFVQWNHSIPQEQVNGLLIGYRVAWDDVHDSEGYADVGLDASSYIVTSLHEYWLYHIRVAGRTSVGHGIYTTVTIMTDDDTPSAPPSDVQLHMANEFALNVQWNDVPLIHQDGVILGYRLRLKREDGGLVVWNITVGPDVHGYIFSGLLIFQNYSIQILAFTIKGDGPLSEKVYQMTDESVPINSPVNLTAHNVSSREIEVFWDYIENPRQVLGNLQGFLLYISEANASDVFTNDAILRKHYTDTHRSTRVGGLEIFRLYNISIAARTVKGAGPKNESVIVRTHGAAPGTSPQSLTAYNSSASSIYASWQEIVEDKRHGIMLGYKLFFYEVTKEGGLQSLENHTYHLAVHEANFTELKMYTKYRIEVLGFNNFGDGPVGAVEVLTDEGVPSEPPNNLTVHSGNSTSLFAKWTPVPECCQFGIIKGYHVTLTDSSNTSVTIRKNATNLEVRFVNLKKFHVYQISVKAFTSKGAGPEVSTSMSTDQDVPVAPPRNFSGYNISQTEIQLFWAPVAQDKANGIVIGYNVSFKEAEGDQPTRYITFYSSNPQAVIGWLRPFTNYKLNVRAFTIKGSGPPSPFITVKTEEEAPQVPPRSFQGINSGSTSILLCWDPIPKEVVAGILRSFYITYRQLDTADNTIYNIMVPITNLTVEITNLRKYTNYSLEIKGVTKFVGAATEPIIVTTDEDIPSLPPEIIKLQNSSSTSISVQWKPIPKENVHGILLGIKLFHRSALRDNSIVFSSRARRATEEDWSNYTVITLPPDTLSYEMTSLIKFTNYSVVIMGFTSKGDGTVSHQFVVSTDEDVPSMPPSNVLHTSSSGDFKVEVTWGPVPDGFVHGILLGYHIYYLMTQKSGGNTGENAVSNTKVISVGPYERNTTVILNNFANYTLEIAAFTIKGDGVRSKIKDGSTCNCPLVFKTTWYPLPPYITHEDGAVGGFIPRILEDAVEYCCSDCLLANGKSASTINFELDGKGNLAQKSSIEALIRSIDSQTDFSAPVNVHKGQTRYSLYPHVELAESPGVAFIAVTDRKVESIAVENLFLETWPLLLLTSIMMLAVGMIMWITETRSNKVEFPRSFCQGVSEGLWWAFITSTTVGYGDRCPRGVLSRMFAIAWALCGLVVIAILTGKITTALTDYKYSETNMELYGAEVAAIVNNSDFRLGVLKSAKMNSVRNYQTYEEISQALRNGEVKGALVDLYVLSSHKHLFDDPHFRIVRVYDYKASYGVVLAGHSMNLEKCFKEYTKTNAQRVFRRIEQNINSLKEPDFDLAEQQSISPFNVKSTKYITTVIIIMALLLLACMLGIIYERRRRKISTVLKQSKDLKNEMSPLVKSFLVSIKKNVAALSKRHREERCHVMQVEREREQEAADTVNKYCHVLSLRDIRQDWSHRHKPLKSEASSLNSRKSRNPTQWPFTEATNQELTNPHCHESPALFP